MTPEIKARLDEIRKREMAATSGPWIHTSTCHQVNYTYEAETGLIVSDLVGTITRISKRRHEQQKYNGQFIAASRTDIPDSKELSKIHNPGLVDPIIGPSSTMDAIIRC